MVAKKKTSGKKTAKKVTKKTSKKISKKTSSPKKYSASSVKKVEKRESLNTQKGIGSFSPNSKFYNQKFNLVIKNLFLFGVLFVLSVVLFSVTTNSFYQNLFLLLGMLFGFLTLAFLIVLLVFVFVKFIKKK